MSRQFQKLKTLLLELFQLDQPDLDFGIYRILHARAAEITRFLEQDLLPQVKEAFAVYKSADRVEIEKRLQTAIQQAEGLGADPETLPAVQALRKLLAEAAVDVDALEAAVYDHLYSFFRRYYSEGDFLSKRVYKPGVYAIPYEGEEVKLHWANADQYYIKTSEYLRDYAFRLRPDDAGNPMRVHFRLTDAAEGEHGNVKEAAGKERRFLLVAGDFLSLEEGETGPELVLRFEYRPPTLQDWGTGGSGDGETRKPPAQKDLLALAEARILAGPALPASWQAELKRTHVRADGEPSDYTRLRAHLNRYAARNTFDYFIHKNLGGFLRRELDFYIKNEVMHLDDIESESVPKVEQYLSQIKVIRRIAGRLIDFLAQTEDFQKKLWLKKKLVVETGYCLRLDRIPARFYPEIVANTAQLAEWKALHGITPGAPTPGGLFSGDADETHITLAPGRRVPRSCMVDTRHFEAGFTARLLDAVADLEGETDGVLFDAENFQALTIVGRRFGGDVKCIYIDPPYNTGGDGFAYRDTYQHSSWVSLIADRVLASDRLLSSEGAWFISIDDGEHPHLRLLLASLLSPERVLANIVWRRRSSPDARATIGGVHDYLICLVSDPARPKACVGRTQMSQARLASYANPDDDARGAWASVDMTGMIARATAEQFYKITLPSGRVIDPPDGRSWGLAKATFEQMRTDGRIWFGRDGDSVPRIKKFLDEANGQTLSTYWDPADVGTNDEANGEITDLFGSSTAFQSPKPTRLIRRVAEVGTPCEGPSRVLDFFAGSGTTGHAVINLNREDGGRRRFILVEMGEHFDTVLLPRLKKVTLTPGWKDGRPKRLPTPEEIQRGPRLLKYLRLESYEDTLNNLEVRRTQTQQTLLEAEEAQGPDGFREEYLLRYLLDVETRGSQSLLNVAAFTDPTAYRLKVKRPGTDETRLVNVDLIETFNWLIGLTVRHLAAPQTFAADFERDSEGRLRLQGRLRATSIPPSPHPPASPSPAPPVSPPPKAWWFRTVAGALPDERRALVIWRKLTGDPEQDNLVLDEWFTRQGYSSKDSEFDVIYVNGGTNLENLKTPDDAWKVRLIEEDFHRLMFDTEGL